MFEKEAGDSFDLRPLPEASQLQTLVLEAGEEEGGRCIK